MSLELERLKATEIKIKEQEKELTETRKKMEHYKEEYDHLYNELHRNKEELRLVSETSRRDLDLLTFKDKELIAIKNE